MSPSSLGSPWTLLTGCSLPPPTIGSRWSRRSPRSPRPPRSQRSSWCDGFPRSQRCCGECERELWGAAGEGAPAPRGIPTHRPLPPPRTAAVAGLQQSRHPRTGGSGGLSPLRRALGSDCSSLRARGRWCHGAVVGLILLSSSQGEPGKPGERGAPGPPGAVVSVHRAQAALGGSSTTV